MEVNAVSAQTEGIVPNGEAARTKPKNQHKVRVNPANEDIPEGDKTKGVIRNLLDGHYKGVADVRLRIVHFEELAQIENANLKEAAGDNVGQLLGSVDSTVNELLNSIPPTEANSESEDAQDTAAIVTELHQEFTASVNQLMQDFVASDNPSTNSLVMEIEGLFEAFMTSLKDLLIPPAEEPLTETEPTEPEEELPAPEPEAVAPEATEEEPPAIEPELTEPTALEQEPPAAEPEPTATEEPTEGQPELVAPVETEEPPALEVEPEPTAPAEPDYTSLIDSISTAFEAAISGFTQVLNSTTALPELTEPTGNGAAYDKFLTIYNQMLGIETAQEESTTGEGLDTIA
jgi:hypothetical protein